MPGIELEDPGELIQKLGEEGARRAKLWLDATTRVSASWSVYDEYGASKLKFPWPNGGKGFSYDLGGVLHGGGLDKQNFLVECKKYSSDNQGPAFDKFLAQSYVMLKTYPFMADQIMWITWHPFRIKSWNVLHAVESIETALVAHGERVFGTKVEDDVKAQIDAEVVRDLAERIWVIVLSDRQETLVISAQDRAEVMKIRTLKSEG